LQIEKQKKELDMLRNDSNQRETKLLQKFCLILNEKKAQIKLLQEGKVVPQAKGKRGNKKVESQLDMLR
jgi:hypothetical protein